jgi:hypothetical protein
MPYINEYARKNIAVSTDLGYGYGQVEEVIRAEQISNAGELQYAIAVLIKNYMSKQDLRYQVCNDVMGALAGAQMEFYRRIVAPYEDQKIEENGDVTERIG